MSDHIPICRPALHGVRVVLLPFLRDFLHLLIPSLFGGGVIYCFQVGGKSLFILICDILQCVPDLMHNTTLVFCLGIGYSNRVLDSRQTVGTKDHDILDSPVFQFIQNTEPVFTAFVLTDLD